MFALSKLVGFLAHPLAWVALLSLLGLLWQCFGRHRTGAVLHVLALVWLVWLGWEWPAAKAVATLELQYPVLREPPPGVHGIIVLGGSTDRSSIWDDGKRSIPLNGAAERLTAMTMLMKRHPQWRVIHAGGNGGYFVGDKERSEAALTRAYLTEQGMPLDRVQFEGQSRNTIENARLSAQLPGVDKQAKWLLVTSAWHMPRAMESFRREGWNVQAYPVDFRSDPYVTPRHYAFQHGVPLWHIYLRESLGMWALQNLSWGSR